MDPWTFTTAEFESKDQREAWSEWFRPVFDVYPRDVECQSFVADYRVWSLGHVTMTKVSAPASRSVRMLRHVNRSPADHWVVTYSRDGSTLFSNDGETKEIAAGMPFVWSLGEASDSKRSQAERLQLYIPRDCFPDIAASLDATIGMSQDSSLGRLLADYMVLLEGEIAGLLPSDARRLGNAVAAMFSACVVPSPDRLAASGRQIDHTMMGRLRNAVRKHLRSPSLNPRMLCREVGMSRTHLYRLLESEGGIARYIQRRRLLESFAMLSDASCTLPVSVIAEDLCFGDASTFSRVFRREFGVSPTDVRYSCPPGHTPPLSPSVAQGQRTFAECLGGY